MEGAAAEPTKRTAETKSICLIHFWDEGYPFITLTNTWIAKQ